AMYVPSPPARTTARGEAPAMARAACWRSARVAVSCRMHRCREASRTAASKRPPRAKRRAFRFTRTWGRRGSVTRWRKSPTYATHFCVVRGGLVLVSGVLLAACGGSPAMRAAERGDLAALRAEIGAREKVGDLSNREAAKIAYEIAEREVRNAKGDEAA